MHIETPVYLALPEAPHVPGLRFRRWRGEADQPALDAIFVACQEADEIDPRSTHEAIVTPEELATALALTPRFDPAHDLLVAEAAGAPVALVMVTWWTGHAEWVYPHQGYVHPAWRRQGIGRALVRWAERRARELALAQAGAEERAEYAAGATETEPGTAALLAREGYTIHSRWAAMVLEGFAAQPEPPLPRSIAVRPFAPEHLPAIWAAYTDVYGERWLDAPPTEEEFRAFQTRFSPKAGFMPELSRVAWAGQTVVAYTLCKEGRARGAFDTVGTRPDWRRRGLARALLVRSLNAMAARGLTHCALHADLDEPTGAKALYERLGFQTVQ
ncbi:MAG TPA: GNAT family N-acetyltransferase, partial [Ktedonobacterales bacterium]